MYIYIYLCKAYDFGVLNFGDIAIAICLKDSWASSLRIRMFLQSRKADGHVLSHETEAQTCGY